MMSQLRSRPAHLTGVAVSVPFLALAFVLATVTTADAAERKRPNAGQHASPAAKAQPKGDPKPPGQQDGRSRTKSLGTFGDWRAFTYEEGGNKVCYVSSQPKKVEPKGKVRGDAYILITHRPAENSTHVVSVTAGYTYKAGSEAVATVDRRAFRLFTEGDTAWARDDTTDKGFTTAVRTGQGLVVKATSSRGTNTTDTYSLKGSGDALKAIGEACGVKG